MSEHIFTRTFANGKWNIDNVDRMDSEFQPISLAAEIEAALPGKSFNIRKSSNEVKVVFEEALSAGDETTLNDTITNHQVDQNKLEAKKKSRCQEVDQRTGELISAGFTYDSTTFSMSSLAQTNWIGLKQAAQNNLISYPFGISTKDDGEYVLADNTEVTNFYVAGLGTKITHLASGRALRQSIKAATTEAEVDAVVDNR